MNNLVCVIGNLNGILPHTDSVVSLIGLKTFVVVFVIGAVINTYFFLRGR